MASVLQCLPDDYLQHFAMFSEAIRLLLGDDISEADPLRAELLCDQYYERFSILYGKGSCGLNFHNVGFHLVDFIREWALVLLANIWL